MRSRAQNATPAQRSSASTTPAIQPATPGTNASRYPQHIMCWSTRFAPSRPRQERGSSALVGALAILGLAAANQLWTQLTIRVLGFEPPTPPSGTDPLFGAPPVEVVDALLWRAFVPGVFEELLFRGVLFGALRSIGGPIVAIFGSALLFGAVHGGLQHALIATLLGLQLGAIRETSGLSLAIVAHAFNNTIVLALVDRAATESLLRAGISLDMGLFIALGLSGIAWAVLWQSWRSLLQPEDDPRSLLQAEAGDDD